MNEGDTTEEIKWINVLAPCLAIGDLCFNEAHWILAFFYFKIAQNMPRVKRGEKVKSYEVLRWFGIVFNAVTPIVFGIYFYLEYVQYFNQI